MSEVNGLEELLWVQKYRPRKVADCVLPEELKKTFQSFVDQGSIPNLLLSGSPGVGKTTVALAMCNEIGADYIVINGSLNGNIDTLRSQIQQFASTLSFVGGRKYVIIDECDFVNPNSTQPALRNFMEEYSKNCGFILTCNYKNKIIPALHSRCAVIDFNVKKKDYPSLAMSYFKVIKNILDSEGIEYDKQTVSEVVKKYFPDNRRILNELQRLAKYGAITKECLESISNFDIGELIDLMKKLKSASKLDKRYDKETKQDSIFNDIRKWVVEHVNNDVTTMYRALYDNLGEELQGGNSIAGMIQILSEYQYKSAFVYDQEINLMACIVDIMATCDFKE